MLGEEEDPEQTAWSRIEVRLQAALSEQPVEEEDRELASMLCTQRKKKYIREMMYAMIDCQASPPRLAGLERILAPLRQIDEKHWRQQILSAWILRQAELPSNGTNQAVTTLCSTLNRYNRNRRAIRGENIFRAVKRTYLFSLTLFWLLGISGILFGRAPVWTIFVDLFYGVFLAVICTVPLLLFGLPLSRACDMRRANSVRVKISAALGAHPQTQSVYDLTETALSHNALVSSTALEALANVLPTLDASHYGQLPAQTIPNLCRLLDARSQAIRRFVGSERNRIELRLLDALAYVGDARAIKSVGVLTRDDVDAGVRSRAEEVLAILVERDRQEMDAKMLLRGSSLPASRPNELLRAATSVAADTDVVQLVRPSDANQS